MFSYTVAVSVLESGLRRVSERVRLWPEMVRNCWLVYSLSVSPPYDIGTPQATEKQNHAIQIACRIFILK